MKSIEFTDSEIVELKKFYQQELETTRERLDSIEGILNRLDTDKGESEENQVIPKQPDSLKTEKSSQPETRGKKRKESKSKWQSFILELLRQHVRPIIFDDIVEEAISEFNIPEDKYKNVRQAIINSSLRLITQHKKIKNFKVPGIKGKYYGLTNWFDKTGELKEKYKGKLTPTLTEKPKTQKRITKKVTGKKPIWVPFVLNTIKEKDTLLQSRTLTNLAIEKFKVKESDNQKTRHSVSAALKDQEKKTKKLKCYSINGVIGKYYGLPEWFDNNGIIKESYLSKLE